MAFSNVVKSIVVLFALAFAVDGVPASKYVVVPRLPVDFTYMTVYCVPPKILETIQPKTMIKYSGRQNKQRRESTEDDGQILDSIKNGIFFGVSGKQLSESMSDCGFKAHEVFETKDQVKTCKEGETYMVAFQNENPAVKNTDNKFNVLT